MQPLAKSEDARPALPAVDAAQRVIERRRAPDVERDDEPAEHRGVSVTELGIIDADSLNAQLGLEGLILRMRAVTIQRGGHIREHDHYTRPGLVYMVDGTWVEGRPDGETTYRAGVDETMPEDKDTLHRVYNRTDQPATAIVCGIQPSG